METDGPGDDAALRAALDRNRPAAEAGIAALGMALLTVVGLLVLGTGIAIGWAVFG